MTDNWYDVRPQSVYSKFKEISISEDWFKVYEIATNLFVFHEPRHYEETIANLVVGQQKERVAKVKAWGDCGGELRGCTPPD